VTGGASAGGAVVGTDGVGAGSCCAAADETAAVVDETAEAAGAGVDVGADVTGMVDVVLADNCTGSICPGAGGTVDASARVSPSAAPATRTIAATKL
jgi:hypothetical protein